MRWVVTGANGFIGTNLVNRLEELGETVFRVDKKESLYDRRPYTHIDLNYQISPTFPTSDVVVHLAAESGVIPSLHNPVKVVDQNIKSTLNSLDYARRKSKMFIFVSSGGTVVGDSKKPVNENSKLNPESPYGATKVAGEALTQAFSSAYGLEHLIFRFSNVYGPFSVHKHNLIPNYIKSAIFSEDFVLRSSTAIRDYVYVDDVVDAIISGGMGEFKHNQTYQLGTQRGLPTSHVLTFLNESLENYNILAPRIIHSELSKGEIERNVADTRKIHKQGWEPKYELEDGLDATVDWFNDFYSGL